MVSVHAGANPVRISDGVWRVTCACGHEAEGRNPDNARNKHEVHIQIEDARAALREGTH